MARIQLNKFLIAIIASLLILLAAQLYWLINIADLQKTEFNKTINALLEKTITEEREYRADSISTLMRRMLMDTSITRITSKQHSVRKTMIYEVEDVKGIAKQKSDFSLNFENRPITGHSDTVKKIIVDYIVNSFRNAYLEYNAVTYYTAVSGDSAVKLSDRLQLDTLQLVRIYQQQLAMLGIHTPFRLHTSPVTDTIATGNTNSLQTRLYKTDIFRKDKVMYIYASFSDPLQWMIKRMMLAIVLSAGVVLLITGLLYYFYKTIHRQKKLAELKNDFIDNMTHELKTPIATISAAAEAMQHFDVMRDSASTSKYIHIIREQAGQLGTIVNKVLDISLYENRVLPLKLERISLRELLDKVKIKCIELFTNSGAHIEIAVENIYIVGDTFHLSNVFYNLLDNAIRYSADSGVKIIITGSHVANGVKIEVGDDGKGISREHVDFIFDKFYRVPQQQYIKGTGLGLFYVKKIIELHKGNITVSSTVGKGTTFSILLPSIHD